MITRKVRLPLKQVFKPYLSSGDYTQGLEKTLNLLDVIYTYFFRYPWLFDSIENNSDKTRGFALDLCATTPGVGIGFTLLIGAIAAASAMDNYKKDRKAEKAVAKGFQDGYQLVKDKLQPNSFLGTPGRIKSVNQYLARLLQENEELRQKYSEIRITDDENLEFTINLPKKENTSLWNRISSKVATFVHSSWIFLSLASFAYWILWIGYGVLTGDFATTGIGPLGAAGFAIPLAIGALYPIIKIRNWWKNKFGQKKEKSADGKVTKIEEDPQLKLKAASDACKLMRKIILADERARLREELGLDAEIEEQEEAAPVNHLSSDDKVKNLGRLRGLKAITAFISTAISTFICAQYGAWIVTDLLKAAANVTITAASAIMGVSIAIVVCSGLYGLYKAYQRYKEVKKYGDKIKEFEDRMSASRLTLEETYESKRARLADLRKEIAYLSRSPADLAWLAAQAKQMEAVDQVSLHRPEVPKPKTTWEKVKQVLWGAYSLLTAGTTGIMIVRMLTIVGSGIFVLGVLSNPYTLPLLGVGFAVWGAFSMIKNYLAKKEAKDKALFDKRHETIDVLKDQNKVLDLQIQLMEKKKFELQQKEVAEEKYRDHKVRVTQELPLVSKQSMFKKPEAPRSLDDMDKPRPSNGTSLPFFKLHAQDKPAQGVEVPPEAFNPPISV